MIQDSINTNKWYKNIVESGGEQSRINNRIWIKEQDEIAGPIGTKLLLKDWYAGLDLSGKTIYFDTSKDLAPYPQPSSSNDSFYVGFMNQFSFFGINIDGWDKYIAVGDVNGLYQEYIYYWNVMSFVKQWYKDNVVVNDYIVSFDLPGNDFTIGAFYNNNFITDDPVYWSLSDAWVYI